ncbi:MAG: hypothetical protein RIQ50_810 [Bacteroidota bacterium]
MRTLITWFFQGKNTFKSLIISTLLFSSFSSSDAVAQVGAAGRDRDRISDLQLVKTSSRSFSKVGQSVIFTLTITNLGPSFTEGAYVSDILPNGFTFVSTSHPQDYNPLTGLWDVGDLALGQSTSITITALINPITLTTEYTNIARIVDFKNPDPNPANNQSAFTVTAYDLSVAGQRICANSSASLTATSQNVTNPIYKWYVDAQLTQLVHTGATYTTPILNASTPYYVTVIGANVPSARIEDAEMVMVEVLSLPSKPVLALVQPTCSTTTGSITVSAPKANGFTYSIDGSTYQNLSGAFQGVLPGTYQVTVKSADGCISEATTAIIQTQPVTPVAPSLSVVHPTCDKGTGTIAVSAPLNAGNTFSINGSDYSNTSGVFELVPAGTYNVTVKSAQGCISAATTAVVNPHPLTPAAPVFTITQPTCDVNSGTITISSPTGNGFTYSADGATFLNNTGVFLGLAPGAYSVLAKNASGCVSAPVVAVINPLSVIEPPLTITADGSTTICEGTKVTLTASEAPTYQWYKYGVAIAGANARTFEASAEGVYTVSRANRNACPDIHSAGVLVKVSPTPVAPTLSSAKTFFCVGSSLVITSNNVKQIRWYRDGVLIQGANSTTLTVNLSGSYTAVSVNDNGCVSAFSNALAIAAIPLPVTPVLTIAGTSKFCANETRLLKVEIPAGITANWFRNNVSLGFNKNFDSLRVKDAAEYKVEFVNASGCTSISSNVIKTEIVCPSSNLFVPDGFTPNGDGINDEIRPIAPGIAKLKWFRIYNRWGNLLFESSDLKKGWDGTYRGQQQPPETYMWVVEGLDTNGKSIKKTGMLTLIR